VFTAVQERIPGGAAGEWEGEKKGWERKICYIIWGGVGVLYLLWEIPRKPERGGAGQGGEYSWASYVRPVIFVGSSDCAQTKPPPVRGDNRRSLFCVT
jgi:hypothetical protein